MSNVMRCLLLLLCVLAPARALAQNLTDTFISFETDCTGGATPGSFDFTGYKSLPTGLYAPCGLLSITSSGTFGGQQLHDPPLGNIQGQSGNVVATGALSVNGALTQGTIELVFSPAVNELSFDVLDLNNSAADALNIALFAASGASLGSFDRGPDAQLRVQFQQSSTTPISKVVLEYTATGVVDGWFLDAVHFNVWSCGDGEVEAGAGEDCEDADDVECDGCDTECHTSLDGCLVGGGCVADGSVAPASFGCASCDLSQRTPGDDVGYSPAAADTSCDRGEFCTLDGVCNGTGDCVGADRDCSDALDCTADTCDEATDTCLHSVAAGCFIDGACHATSDRNPDEPCEACQPSTNRNGWTALTGGETCGEPSCSEGVLTPAPTCDGSGECVAGEPMDCEGAVCADSVSCVGECKEDDDCLEELHCEAGTCIPDIPQGNPCARDGECESGFCVDGVCCDAACDSGCESCKLAGQVGMCTVIEPGTDPENECKGDGVCSAEQTCVTYEVRGNGFCAVPAPGRRGLGELALLAVAGAACIFRRRRRRTAS
jgi:hypothetical protein